MKRLFWISIILLVSCNKGSKNVTKNEEILKTSDTLSPTKTTPPDLVTPKKYSNERFREVTVEKVNGNKFRVRGEGQIFEANFNWVVEDGHNELKKGFEMTDAGAPEWGKFDFTFDVSKNDENTTLTLIIFELSAKDGSRQHELPIAL